jgi:hypothetical protein
MPGDREERTTATGLWMFAESYRDAANLLAQRASELRHQAPIYYLYAHSIELALKAALRAKGVTVEDLSSKRLGHDLMKLLAECRKLRLQRRLRLGKRREAILSLLTELNREHELRYIKTGATSRPTLGILREIAARVLDAARLICVTSRTRRVAKLRDQRQTW